MNFNKLLSVQFLVICVAAFVTAFGLSFLLTENKTEPITQFESPTEIALIYFGCSTCPAATNERIPELLSSLSEKLKKTAVSKGYEFSFIGTSNENNLEEGLEYLTDIATFDEISLGNGMENTTLQHYVWDNFDNPLSASTPQIIVSKRTYDTRTVNKQDVILDDIISEEILARRIGIKRIAQLAEREKLFSSL